MKHVAAIVLFAVALIALAGSFAGAGHGRRQVQFVVQPVKVVNTPADGGWVPVANDPTRPLYVIAGNTAPVAYEYRVQTFTPPTVAGAQDGVVKIDESKLAAAFQAFLNQHADWEVVSAPTEFKPEPTLVVFRYRRQVR